MIWRLTPLLAIRARQEEVVGIELGRALHVVRSAEADAEISRENLARREGALISRGVALGAEILAAQRFLDGLRKKAGRALERASDARMAAAQAGERLLGAREARERLERAREGWLEERRRAREARMERELEEIGVGSRCYRVRP